MFGLLKVGKEGVEEGVVVVGEPEAGVAAVEAVAVAVEGVVLGLQEGVERILSGKEGFDVELFLRVEYLGECGKVEL